MARLRVELRDMAALVREIVNRRKPLVAENFGFGKWPFESQLEVTWHSLDEVRVDGPIVLESELDAVQRTLRFDALAPNLSVSGPCTVTGGGVLVKDGTRPLEVTLDGAAQIEVRFAAKDADADQPAPPAVHVAITGFRVRSHVFPAWLERRFQARVEQALEEAISNSIAAALPQAVTQLGLASLAERPSDIGRREAEFCQEASDEVPRQSLLSKLSYSASYYLAFGLVYPMRIIGSFIPTENPAVQGLRDGAADAHRGVKRLRAQRNDDPVINNPVVGQARLASATA